MKFLDTVVSTKTFSQSMLTISATVINGFLGMVFYLLVARNIGPSSFGIFALVVAFIALVSDIGALGVDTGIIRFVGKYLHSGNTTLKFLKLGLEVKFYSWILILIFGWLLMPFITDSIMGKPELNVPFRLGLLGIGGSLLFSFVTSSVQAYQKYFYWTSLIIGTNFFRLFVIVIFLLYGSFTVQNVLLAYILIPFLGFLIGMLILPKFLTVSNEWEYKKEFFHYNKWIALVTLVSAVGSRLDIFLSAKFLSLGEVGIYSVAAQLNSFMPQIFFAIGAVAAPKLASFNEKSMAISYLKKLQLLSLGIVLLGLLGIPIAIYLIPKFYGFDYTGAILPFIIIYIGQLLFLAALPAHQAIFYFFAKPRVMFILSFLQTIIIFIACLFLIPKLGILGAAWSVLIGSIFMFVLSIIWVLDKFTKK